MMAYSAPVYYGCLLIVAAVTIKVAATQPSPSDEANYWKSRRAEFYANTTFELNEDNQRLLGGKFSPVRLGHLPFWFDYELFKRVFNRPSQAATPDEELKRHNIYINTCLRTIKARTLFRMLSGTRDAVITSQADQFYDERQRLPSGAKSTPNTDLEGPEENIIDIVGQLRAERSAELPVERAVRLMRLELDQVESRNQVETYLRAFDELDGSAIAGRLPY